MSRVINPNTPGKTRNYNLRTIAELLNRLGRKTEIDSQAIDMASAIVLSLWNIRDAVDQTVTAWEKRDYWMKAERFERKWLWANEVAANIDDVIRNEAWDLLPPLLADLSVNVADIQVKTMTRKQDAWQGAHQKLLQQEPRPTVW